MVNWVQKGLIVKFLETVFASSFCTNSVKFREFDTRNLVLFQIKVFGVNIKETTLERVIRRINEIHQISK